MTHYDVADLWLMVFHVKRFKIPMRRGLIKELVQDVAAQAQFMFHVKQSLDVLRRVIKTS